MKSAPAPSNEQERLNALHEYHLLDTLPEDVYEEITEIATEICGTPIASITLVDKDRQWFKSKQGLNVSETSRETSFCAHAINKPGEILLVPDARYDERFHDNPLTTSDPFIIFYAGVPIVDDNGFALGTLCVMDNRPRELPEPKLEALKALSKLVKAHFTLRKTNFQLEQEKKKNEEARTFVQQWLNEVESQTNQQDTREKLKALQSRL